MHSARLINSIKTHEGFRDTAYQDTEGVWTIGYGTNLQELKVDEAWAAKKMMTSINDAHEAAERFPEWEHLDTRARRDAFVEMIYNMGPRRVAGFRNTLRAIREGDWDDVEREMLDSKWARQVGRRAHRLAKQMRTGVYWNVNTIARSST